MDKRLCIILCFILDILILNIFDEYIKMGGILKCFIGYFMKQG